MRPMPALFALAAVSALACACGNDDGPGASMPDAGGCPPSTEMGPGGHCFERVPCPDTIPEFVLGLRAEGAGAGHVAELVDANPSPPRLRYNEWVIELTGTGGDPLDDAAITDAESFMVAHNHDGYVAPIVTPEPEPGRFRVERINLWMPGPWEVRFWTRAADGDDYIVFDVCVE